MDCDFSFVKESASIAPIALMTVYMLKADRSYNVKRGAITERNLIALRTLDGLGKIKTGDRDEISLTPNTLLFCRYPEVKSYSCVGENWDFWWFEFSCGEAHNLPMNKLLTIDQVENEPGDCHSCLELLRKNDARATALASATLNALIYKWLLNYESDIDTNPHKESIRKVMEYIGKNSGRDITVKELADMAGLCERRFRQVFADIAGMQPKKFIDGLRIRTAEELLKNTPFSIEDISYRLGYSSQFHFCRAFQKCHGLPPSQFRKK